MDKDGQPKDRPTSQPCMDKQEALIRGLSVWATTRALHDQMHSKRSNAQVAEDAVRAQMASLFHFDFDTEELDDLRGFMIVSGGAARAVVDARRLTLAHERMHLWFHFCGHLAVTSTLPASLFLQLEPLDRKALAQDDTDDEDLADQWALEFAERLCKRVGQLNPFIQAIVAAIRVVRPSDYGIRRALGVFAMMPNRSSALCPSPHPCRVQRRIARLGHGRFGPLVYRTAQPPLGYAPV